MRTSEVTSNPLLDEWRAVVGGQAPYGWRDRGLDPEFAYRRRKAACAAFSFAVPTDEALDLIASFGPVVEIGAGTGYWAALLGGRGCDVVAYDHLDRSFKNWFPSGLLYADVRRGGTRKAEQHADRTLLLVWPPYASPMAVNALRYYQRGGGRRVVFVGEGYGGCTGDDDFFAALHADCWDEPCRHAPQWRQTHELAIPQWDGINDSLTVYERVGA